MQPLARFRFPERWMRLTQTLPLPERSILERLLSAIDERVDEVAPLSTKLD